MSLRALIFDVDGTLAETEEVHRKAFNQTFAEAGLDWHWSKEDYARLLRTTGGKERMRAFRAERDDPSPSDSAIAELHTRKTALYGKLLASGALQARPGVLELIAAAGAAGLKLAIATTTNRSNVDALCMALWDLPAHQIFPVIAAGDEVQAKKPAPDIYTLALERLGLTPAEALAFEDSANGLLSAKAAGLRVVAFPSAYTSRDDLTPADWLADDLSPQNLAPLRNELQPQSNTA